MSKLSEQLHIGSSLEAKDKKWLKDHFITHIVNCTTEHDNYFPNEIKYLKLNIDDTLTQSLYPVLEKSYDFIRRAISNGGTVLVHCHAGISRSSSVVLYFIMKIKNWSYDKAYGYLKKLHPRASPNSNFVKQLISVSPEVKNFFQKRPDLHPYVLYGGESKDAQNYTRPHTIESRSILMRRLQTAGK